MSKEKIFIIGGGSSQVDFISTVKNNGYEAVVFDYNPRCEGVEIADKFYCISTDDKDSILDIAIKENPVAVHTVATEAGNITACYVGEKLGLNTNSYKTALNTVDKSLMKKVFEENDIPTAKVIRLYNEEDLKNVALPFPFVVKASDRSGGRGVALVSDSNELVEAYKEAYKESNNKIVLAEEYIQGEQYSVETVSQKGQHHILGVTKEHFIDQKDFVECHQLLPAFNEKEIIESYDKLFIKILDVFQIKYGACHIEFRIHENEIRIIEIASRMGGNRFKLLNSSKSIDYNQLVLNSITNNPLDINFNDNGFALVKVIFTSRDFCTYKSICRQDSNIIISHPTNIGEIHSIRPKSAADTKGFYYLGGLDLNKVNELLSIWEKDNRDMEQN